MNLNFEQFIHELKGVGLEKNDKARMRSYLLDYAKTHPAQEAAISDAASPHSVFKAGGKFFHFLFFPNKVSIVAFGLGTATLAEDSLPGDMLYPVKIGLHRVGRSLFVVSAEAKANWEVDQAEQRLREASQLISKNRVDEQQLQRIQAQIEEHTQKVATIALQLEEKQKTDALLEVYSKYESTFTSYSAILEHLKE